MREFAKDFYLSKAWRTCRNAYMKSVGGLCEDCLKKGMYTAAEEVHHIRFITQDNINDPSVTLNWGNLVALCRECHKARHRRKEARFTVDAEGNISPL